MLKKKKNVKKEKVQWICKKSLLTKITETADCGPHTSAVYTGIKNPESFYIRVFRWKLLGNFP